MNKKTVYAPIWMTSKRHLQQYSALWTETIWFKASAGRFTLPDTFPHLHQRFSLRPRRIPLPFFASLQVRVDKRGVHLQSEEFQYSNGLGINLLTGILKARNLFHSIQKSLAWSEIKDIEDYTFREPSVRMSIFTETPSFDTKLVRITTDERVMWGDFLLSQGYPLDIMSRAFIQRLNPFESAPSNSFEDIIHDNLAFIEMLKEEFSENG